MPEPPRGEGIPDDALDYSGSPIVEVKQEREETPIPPTPAQHSSTFPLSNTPKGFTRTSKPKDLSLRKGNPGKDIMADPRYDPYAKSARPGGQSGRSSRATSAAPSRNPSPERGDLGIDFDGDDQDNLDYVGELPAVTNSNTRDAVYSAQQDIEEFIRDNSVRAMSVDTGVKGRTPRASSFPPGLREESVIHDPNDQYRDYSYQQFEQVLNESPLPALLRTTLASQDETVTAKLIAGEMGVIERENPIPNPWNKLLDPSEVERFPSAVCRFSSENDNMKNKFINKNNDMPQDLVCIKEALVELGQTQSIQSAMLNTALNREKLLMLMITNLLAQAHQNTLQRHMDATCSDEALRQFNSKLDQVEQKINDVGVGLKTVDRSVDSVKASLQRQKQTSSSSIPSYLDWTADGGKNGWGPQDPKGKGKETETVVPSDPTQLLKELKAEIKELTHTVKNQAVIIRNMESKIAYNHVRNQTHHVQAPQSSPSPATPTPTLAQRIAPTPPAARRETPKVTFQTSGGYDSEMEYVSDSEQYRTQQYSPAPMPITPPIRPPAHPQSILCNPTPVPTPPPINEPTRLGQGANFFLNEVETASVPQLAWWCKVLSWGQWGPVEQLQISGRGKSAEQRKQWITRAIQRAFTPGSYMCFLLRPTDQVGRTINNTVNFYGWNRCVYNGLGVPTRHPPNTPIKVIGPPGAAHTSPHVPPSSHGQYYEDVNSQPEPWTTVSHKRSYSQAASPVNNTPSGSNVQLPPVHPTKRTKIDEVAQGTQYIVRFPGLVEQKMTPLEITYKVNDIAKANPAAYRYTCMTAKWTQADNIVLSFNKNSDKGSIEKAKVSITQALAHGYDDEVSMTINTLWSTVVLYGVPCCAESTGYVDRIGEDGDVEITERELWSDQAITEELMKNDAMKGVTLAKAPTWTKGCIENRELTTGTVFLHMIDPDGSHAKRLLASAIWMWTKRITPSQFKVKVNLHQCTNCWSFTQQSTNHTSCRPKCRKCHSHTHTEKDHNQRCMACQVTYGVEAWKKPTHYCPHDICANCNGPHPADDESCHARKETVQNIRNKRGRAPDQPILNFNPANYSVYNRNPPPHTNQGGNPRYQTNQSGVQSANGLYSTRPQ